MNSLTEVMASGVLLLGDHGDGGSNFEDSMLAHHCFSTWCVRSSSAGRSRPIRSAGGLWRISSRPNKSQYQEGPPMQRLFASFSRELPMQGKLGAVHHTQAMRR